MKPFTAVLLTATLALVAGCANTLPKPVQANGSVSPSVTVAEAKITYTNFAKDATAYVTTCRAAPTTTGCSDRLIAQLKSASEDASRAVNAAEDGVKHNPAGGAGVDQLISDLNIALALLKGFVAQVPAALKGVH